MPSAIFAGYARFILPASSYRFIYRFYRDFYGMPSRRGQIGARRAAMITSLAALNALLCASSILSHHYSRFFASAPGVATFIIKAFCAAPTNFPAYYKLLLFLAA